MVNGALHKLVLEVSEANDESISPLATFNDLRGQSWQLNDLLIIN